MEANILLHLKHKIESLLFSAARKLSITEIKKHTRAEEKDILKCLQDYRKELDERGSSISLEQYGEYWQLTVKEQYLPVIKKVVTQTEMPKSLVETLAVVAYKSPVLQSEIIKIRTNKAYKHLDLLEEQGFLTREKKGRSKLIRLTPKFYDYFNLDPRQVKELFEKKAQNIKTYDVTEDKTEIIKEQIEGTVQESSILEGLQTYGEREEENTSTKNEKEKNQQDKVDEKDKNSQEEKGIKLTSEQEKMVDKRVNEMLGLNEKTEEKEE